MSTVTCLSLTLDVERQRRFGSIPVAKLAQRFRDPIAHHVRDPDQAQRHMFSYTVLPAHLSSLSAL
jgi:hypothetical protein